MPKECSACARSNLGTGAGATGPQQFHSNKGREHGPSKESSWDRGCSPSSQLLTGRKRLLIGTQGRERGLHGCGTQRPNWEQLSFWLPSLSISFILRVGRVSYQLLRQKAPQGLEGHQVARTTRAMACGDPEQEDNAEAPKPA